MLVSSAPALAAGNGDDAGDSDNIDTSEFHEIMDMKVVKAALYERPLFGVNSTLAIYGIKHVGCAIELDTGAKYMVQMFPANPDKFGLISVIRPGGDCKDSAITHVTPWNKINKRAWTKVIGKRVKRATVKDYVEACGKEYDLFNHNCRHAAQDMFNLL